MIERDFRITIDYDWTACENGGGLRIEYQIYGDTTDIPTNEELNAMVEALDNARHWIKRQQAKIKRYDYKLDNEIEDLIGLN